MGPRVVTIGGGHGQATLVGALVRLRCSVTAIVSVADDGGCSGQLRLDTGMAPPGDVRRCLLALATRPGLAARFDERLSGSGRDLGARSAGNLVLAEMFARLGSLQRAVDWAAELLGCVGRVVPVAETPGVLVAYDQERGALAGETTIERESSSTLVVAVEGPAEASPEAKRALAEADLVFIGPGSFAGSTLAALTTGDLAAAIVESPARRVLVQNLAREADAKYGVDQHERIVRDHLEIGSGGDSASLDVLAHAEGPPRSETRADGSRAMTAALCRPGLGMHDEGFLAAALAHHFGLEPIPPRTATDDEHATRIFDDTFEAARARLLR